MSVIDTPVTLSADSKASNIVFSIQKFLVTQLSDKTIFSPYMQIPDRQSIVSLTEWIELEFPMLPTRMGMPGLLQVRCRVKTNSTNPGKAALLLKDAVEVACNATHISLYDCSDPANPTAISGAWIALRLEDGGSIGQGGSLDETFDEILRYQIHSFRPTLQH